MTTSESLLFLGMPAVSLVIGYAIGVWGRRRQWTVVRSQVVAAMLCFLAPLAIFFATEFQAILAAERGFLAAVEGGATTAAVLALACVPLAPIPAYFGAQFAARRGQGHPEDTEAP